MLRLVLFVFMVSFGVIASLAQTSFATGKNISSSADGARSTFAADLDSDGDQDVLAITYNEVLWFENLGSGLFSGQIIISTLANTGYCVLAVDINGDGDSDVLRSSADEIAWYENLGSGSFGSQQVIASSVGGAWCLSSADLDNDGDPDVLSTDYLLDQVVWYENMGGGVFAAKQIITSLADGAFSVVGADLDGDGDQDVLSASAFDDKIAWYENLGGGSFGPQQVISTEENRPQTVYAVDLNGDSLVDVLSATYGILGTDGKISWFENVGGGSFGARQTITGETDNPTSIFTADLDGDGDQDLLSSSSADDEIAYYINWGSGVFGSQQILNADADGAESVFAADLDGDGDADVLSASRLNGEIVGYQNLLGECQVPANLSTFVLDSSTVFLSWDPVVGALGYRIRGREQGSTYEKVVAARWPSKNLFGFKPGKTYEWSVRTACVDDTSAYASIELFSIPLLRTEVLSDVKLYPNPATSVLHIRSAGHLQLFDPTGKKIWETRSSGSVSLNTAGFSPGLYMLQIENESIRAFEKIIIQK